MGVFGGVGENGPAVALGRGVAEETFRRSSSDSVGAAGAQADRIRMEIKSRENQKGSRK